MNERIRYLKTITRKESADVEAFRDLFAREYLAVTDRDESFRKAHFLTCFAECIPVVLDPQELICGSMRFWKARTAAYNKGHIIVDYRMILQEGICGIRNRIAALDTQDAKAFAEAMNAFAVLIGRYAAEAERIPNMKPIAANCHQLLKSPPQTFHQALQLIWFVHLFLHAEATAPAISFGRFDDYLYPFYRADLENGTVTKVRAAELLACFWLKTCEGDESQNLTLGGDIENELTFLCLEVTRQLKVQQPSVSVRICDNTSPALWQSTVELIKCGTGMPAIMNDRAVIPALRKLGISEADARNYAVVGCYEANPDGNTFGTTASAGSFCLHDFLLGFLNPEKTYGDFEEFYNAFQADFANKYNTGILAQFRRNWANIQTKCVSPFQGACMGSCLESGLAAEHGGCKYTMFGINILGIGTLIDSLYVIKKLVFEEKAYEYADFVRQVKRNFPDRALAARCRALPGKYGTDNPETNTMARELSLLIARLVEQGHIADGVIPYAGLFLFLADIRSHNFPATPDGRLQGDRISYGISASDLCVGKTVTSVLNSAAHIANDSFADGNPLMFTLSKKEVAGTRGDVLLQALINGYFQKYGFHMQINVTDAEILKQAQQQPEQYRDLIVRISGYSEYFTRLDTVVQNALIERA